jgi:hypothetical protein
MLLEAKLLASVPLLSDAGQMVVRVVFVAELLLLMLLLLLLCVHR